jgi:sulfotransferase family protein
MPRLDTSANKIVVEVDMDGDVIPSPAAQGNRVLVVSIPKAGTYLMAEVLKALGYGWTGMHLAEAAYSDYKGADLDDARENPGRFARSEPLRQSLSRIRAGEFAVGHLPCKAEVIVFTASFRRLYLTRDLRSALISYMRFLQVTGRMGAKESSWYSISDPKERLLNFLTTSAPQLLVGLYNDLTGWLHVPGVMHVRFEDLVHDPETAVRVVKSVAEFLGDPAGDARGVLSRSLASETITKSEGLTRLDDFWSPEAEEQFIVIGGRELNARLGCAVV